MNTLPCLSTSSFTAANDVVQSAWLEHGPFAFWLVDQLRPRMFVELGAHNGYSYFCFCQAIDKLNISASCYAVDTWVGDEHASFYDESVYHSVVSKNEKYRAFSQLLRMRFDEALQYFPDKSIDLLHIDGRHYYDDVKEDFETWLPKLSSRGVILFHDTQVRERSFGVWKLFGELAAKYPNFNFVHGYGLGVLAIGEIPESLSSLFSARSEDVDNIRRSYARLGSVEYLRYMLDDAKRHQAAAIREATELAEQFTEALHQKDLAAERLEIALAAAIRREVDTRQQAEEQRKRNDKSLQVQGESLRNTQAEINEARAAASQLMDERRALLRQLDREARRPWRPFKRYAQYLLLKMLSLIALLFSERASERFKRSAAKRSPRRFKRFVADAEVERVQEAEVQCVQVASRRPLSTSGPSEWLTYSPMASRIAEDRGRLLQEVRPAPVPFVSLANEELADVVAKIEFPFEERPLVSIVVPVFNNLRFTLECLVSIQKHTDARTPFEVIIADDASTDESSAVLSRICHIVYVRNEQNLGFLMNCNGAARRARGEFVLFLNNDVQVLQDWLAPLVDVFAKNDKIGAAGPRIVYPSGHLQEAGVLVNADCSAQLIGLGDDPGSSRYAFGRPVDYCSGACLILRRKIFEQVGGFSETLRPAYCEDLDLCLKLRELGLYTWYEPQSVILHHLSKTSDALGKDYKMRWIVTNRQKIAERWQSTIDAMNRVRLFAFYLPQFHPIAENDRWWGRGFTEWTNVARGVPMYEGHFQPRLPADHGFYDLRRPETLADQASLARRYGIEAFCFYYYWFGGKRLLETPLENMLASGKPDFPFFLCWANENWTRRWDGMDSEILISQSHSDADDVAVIRDLARYFRDPRYARVNGKPILLVYQVGLFPDFMRTSAIWRELCRAEGIGEIYLAMVASFDKVGNSQPPQSFGCDAVVQFPPHGAGVPAKPPAGLRPDFSGAVYDYEESALNALRQSPPAAPYFPGVMPSWDNTARRMDKATIFKDASPGAFQAWLEEAIRRTCEYNTGDERIVFINAWNEWAEGAHLEPDSQFGHANLEAVRNALLAHNLRTE